MSSASFKLKARKLFPLDFYSIKYLILLTPANVEKDKDGAGRLDHSLLKSLQVIIY